MDDTPAAKLLPPLVAKLKGGTDPQTLATAGALANARTFGGEDYVGFHSFMALLPSYQMAKELPEDHRALPVLKVLYRNSNRMQEFGGRGKEVLHPVEAAEAPKGAGPREVGRDGGGQGHKGRAEAAFPPRAQRPVGEAFNHLQYTI